MTTTVQAISGVSPNAETEITTEYPSIASTPLGRMLGSLYDSIPVRINGIKLSYLLFPLPTAPIGLLVYLYLKVSGRRYRLTNRSVQIWSMIGERLFTSGALSDIAEIRVQELPGQRFFKAGDIVLLRADGSTLVRLEGVVRPEIFRETILEARDARKNVEASLARIQARSA
ncbi:MAG: PH domain-containing protein [Planctomycetaceae bacterium]